VVVTAPEVGTTKLLVVPSVPSSLSRVSIVNANHSGLPAQAGMVLGSAARYVPVSATCWANWSDIERGDGSALALWLCCHRARDIPVSAEVSSSTAVAMCWGLIWFIITRAIVVWTIIAHPPPGLSIGLCKKVPQNGDLGSGLGEMGRFGILAG
jgi:hypothetical protein